VWGTY